MAQSNSNESNVREKLPFWQNNTVDPSILWEEWSDHFHLALIAKKRTKKKFDNEETVLIKTKTKPFNGSKIDEAD